MTFPSIIHEVDASQYGGNYMPRVYLRPFANTSMTVKGTFVDWFIGRNRRKSRVMLLRNIYTMDDQFITDHAWIIQPKRCLTVTHGDVIKFKALVKKYEAKSSTYEGAYRYNWGFFDVEEYEIMG